MSQKSKSTVTSSADGFLAAVLAEVKNPVKFSEPLTFDKLPEADKFKHWNGMVRVKRLTYHDQARIAMDTRNRVDGIKNDVDRAAAAEAHLQVSWVIETLVDLEGNQVFGEINRAHLLTYKGALLSAIQDFAQTFSGRGIIEEIRKNSPSQESSDSSGTPA